MQKLVLRVSADFHFLAGQYLQIAHPSGVLIPLSIASAPHRLPELTLHYQSSVAPDAVLVDQILDAHSRGESEIDIHGPFGDVVLDDTPDEPLLLIAGGTGAAQSAGYVDQMLKTPPIHDVRLLVCAETESDLYLKPWLEDLNLPWLKTVFIADARRTGDNRSLVWLRQQAKMLVDQRIILSGSPGFVYAATDALTTSGISESALESDVFSYAPRD